MEEGTKMFSFRLILIELLKIIHLHAMNLCNDTILNNFPKTTFEERKTPNEEATVITLLLNLSKVTVFEILPNLSNY